MKLIEILTENRLMQTPQEVDAFETALAEIAKNPDENDLTAYHLILDDRCQQPEVMFSLIHFLESFDMEKQIEVFIIIIPQLMLSAPEWTRILHERILNDESACQVYQKLLHLINSRKPHFLYYLLEESSRNHFKNKENELNSHVMMQENKKYGGFTALTCPKYLLRWEGQTHRLL